VAHKAVDIRPSLLTMPLPGHRNWKETSWGRIMWAALLTVAALSLLISSAFAAYATYLYFFGSDAAAQDFTSIDPDEAVPFELDERDV